MDEALERFRAALERRLGDDMVTLAAFGSRVTVTAKPESDLDVLVVARGLPRRRLDRQGLILSIAREVSGEFADQVSPIRSRPRRRPR